MIVIKILLIWLKNITKNLCSSAVFFLYSYVIKYWFIVYYFITTRVAISSLGRWLYILRYYIKKKFSLNNVKYFFFSLNKIHFSYIYDTCQECTNLNKMTTANKTWHHINYLLKIYYNKKQYQNDPLLSSIGNSRSQSILYSICCV